MTVKLHCANFYGFERVYQWMLQAPEIMRRENVELAAAYGCFPGMIWNGGRPQTPEQISLKRVEQEFDLYYNKFHLPIELTFNNMLIKGEYLNDKYCNDILERANEYSVMCTIYSEELKEYIAKKYPSIRFKRSCIACDNGEDYDMHNKFDMSVLNQFKAGDIELLNSIPEELRSKIELVANVECKDGCTQFYKHHRCMSECQLYGSSQVSYKCPLGLLYVPIHFSRLQKHYVSPERAQELSKLGYEHYKLVSRCNAGQSIYESCFYYFKEDYLPDCLGNAFMMMGVPMRVGQEVNYRMYLGNDYVGEICK